MNWICSLNSFVSRGRKGPGPDACCSRRGEGVGGSAPAAWNQNLYCVFGGKDGAADLTQLKLSSEQENLQLSLRLPLNSLHAIGVVQSLASCKDRGLNMTLRVVTGAQGRRQHGGSYCV